LNIIPAKIIHIKAKEKEKPIINKLNEENNHSIEYIYNKPYEKYLSKKDILKFFFICFILLLIDFLENIENIINKDDKNNENNNGDKKKNKDEKYSDDFIFLEFLIFFLISKFGKEVYYMHQNISSIILILLEAIKNIYFFYKNLKNTSYIIEIIINIINSILYATYYLYIKGLMEYKFISPAKCNFMIGIINVPIIILEYFIISFTRFGNIKEEEYYFDNIFQLFKDLGKNDAKSVILLIFLPFAYGILNYILVNTIYDYTIYHIYIPLIIENFIENIIKEFNTFEIVFLILSFLIELIMILVFLEIIEINCCGLNENLKRNIESRGIIDSSLAIENDDDDDDDEIDERNDKIISTKIN
jgi:hypothetical protein